MLCPLYQGVSEEGIQRRVSKTLLPQSVVGPREFSSLSQKILLTFQVNSFDPSTEARALIEHQSLTKRLYLERLNKDVNGKFLVDHMRGLSFYLHSRPSLRDGRCFHQRSDSTGKPAFAALSSYQPMYILSRC